MKKNKVILGIFVSFLILFIVYASTFFTNKQKYLVKTSSSIINVDRSEWKAVENPTDFAENFQRKEKRNIEVFEQMVTVYHSDLTSDKVDRVPQIREGVWLELFLLHPGSVTAQMIVDRGDYWVHSRQTLSIETFSNLKGLNPENTPEDYSLFVSSLNEEFENTIFILKNQF